MLFEIDLQELRILQRALNHWQSRITRQQENAPLPQIDVREHERTASLLARLDALENRTRHFAWGPGDVVFSSDDRT